VGREDLRRSGRTLPPPQPSTADGGRGATGVEAAGQALLLPPHAGEGRDGGGVRRAGLRGSGRALAAPQPPPAGGGGGVTGVGAAGQALLLPPHAGEGRDGGGVGREDLRRSGRTLPPPQPSTADGGRGATGVEAAGQALLLPPHAGEGRDGG